MADSSYKAGLGVKESMAACGRLSTADALTVSRSQAIVGNIEVVIVCLRISLCTREIASLRHEAVMVVMDQPAKADSARAMKHEMRARHSTVLRVSSAARLQFDVDIIHIQ